MNNLTDTQSSSLSGIQTALFIGATLAISPAAAEPTWNAPAASGITSAFLSDAISSNSPARIQSTLDEQISQLMQLRASQLLQNSKNLPDDVAGLISDNLWDILEA